MRAAKRDDNEKEIIRTLQQIGCYVEQTHNFDLLVGFRGQWYRLEVKDGNKPASKRKLTDNEQKLMDEIGNRASVHIVKSVDEALQVIGAVK